MLGHWCTFVRRRLAYDQVPTLLWCDLVHRGLLFWANPLSALHGRYHRPHPRASATSSPVCWWHTGVWSDCWSMSTDYSLQCVENMWLNWWVQTACRWTWPKQSSWLPVVQFSSALSGYINCRSGNSVDPVSVVRDLGVWIDRGLSMSTHITKVVSGCFAVLRQLYSICRSVSGESLIGLVVSLVLPNMTGSLQCCSSWIARIPARSASVRYQCSSSHDLYRTSRYDHVTSQLKEIHWLREFKLCALVYKCLNGSGLAYLADSLQRVTDVQSRRRLRSSSSSTLVVPVTRRATLGAQSLKSRGQWSSIADISNRGHGPPEHGMPYRTSSRQRLRSRRSLPRWRHICFLVPSDNDNTRHTDFITCSWSAVVWWWWWWWWCTMHVLYRQNVCVHV